jgi:hypothetical protein
LVYFANRDSGFDITELTQYSLGKIEFDGCWKENGVLGKFFSKLAHTLHQQHLQWCFWEDL